VTILALGGLLLPLLTQAGFPERRGIGLVTSASALGVLLAPSVPLIMYAIIARVPINTMFLAGLLPALVMVGFLLTVGGFLKGTNATVGLKKRPNLKSAGAAAWAAKWEIMAPVVAIGSLVSGLATPTESAALTAAYAVLTQTVAHRELDGRGVARALVECAQVIGGIMLILGMALGLTNFLIDAGIPDAAIEWVQSVLPNKFAFLIALNLFLLVAGALMEIYAAIVVLVPLLLPVALAYGVDPVHFGVIFLANIEMGFLCPPAGMNIYFASAMFAKPIRYVAAAVVPAVAAMFPWCPDHFSAAFPGDLAAELALAHLDRCRLIGWRSVGTQHGVIKATGIRFRDHLKQIDHLAHTIGSPRDGNRHLGFALIDDAEQEERAILADRLDMVG
jgi:C4-dicarboxylate transporter DctM subunit